MSKKDEALKLALEAIEASLSAGTEDEDHDACEKLCDARKAIREALAEQQPVSAVTEAIIKTIIEVEKLLCEKLSKQWTPSGMSIQTLIDELAALAEQPAQKRPQNCGTGYCSCIECVMEPEQPAQEQEPVAVVSGYYGGQCVVLPTNPARVFNSGTAFYTSPQSKPWVGLTDEEVEDLYFDGFSMSELKQFARAIEAKLREKNA